MSSEDAFRSEWEHVDEQGVAWGDMDALDHVNNTLYFRYYESARISFLRDLKGMIPDTLAGIGPILAFIDCQFLLPLTYPDEILVGSRIDGIGNTSVKMSQAIFSRALGKMAATSKSVLVIMNYRTGQKVAVPDVVRDKYSAL